MVIQTKQVFKYVLHWNIIIVLFYISMNKGHVFTSSWKNMLPILEFHEILSTYS